VRKGEEKVEGEKIKSFTNFPKPLTEIFGSLSCAGRSQQHRSYDRTMSHRRYLLLHYWDLLGENVLRLGSEEPCGSVGKNHRSENGCEQTVGETKRG
jgi:hypothetical protein